MKPVEPDELSALLDGELEPARAEEVRAQIQIDPKLQEEWNALRNVHERMQSAAAQAFQPSSVLIPISSLAPTWLRQVGVAVTVLLGARLLTKTIDAELIGWVINAGALIFALGLVVALLRAAEGSEGDSAREV